MGILVSKLTNTDEAGGCPEFCVNGHLEGNCRIDRKTLLADGTYYLCEHAGAFWLASVFASYLYELEINDWFALLKLTVADSAAKVIIEDGNDNVLATQEIEYTDFSLPDITLYGFWDSGQCVLMLPSEY